MLCAGAKQSQYAAMLLPGRPEHLALRQWMAKPPLKQVRLGEDMGSGTGGMGRFGRSCICQILTISQVNTELSQQ